jgi:hypothetical protein
MKKQFKLMCKGWNVPFAIPARRAYLDIYREIVTNKVHSPSKLMQDRLCHLFGCTPRELEANVKGVAAKTFDPWKSKLQETIWMLLAGEIKPDGSKNGKKGG